MPRKSSIDPLSTDNVLNQPEPGLLDLFLGALRAAPGGWGDVSNMSDMFARNYTQQRQRHLADVAQQGLLGAGLFGDMPTDITEQRGPVGSFAQSLGILGPPQPRPLTPEEQHAYITGTTSQLDLMSKLGNMALTQAKLKEIQAATANMPLNQRLKIIGAYLNAANVAGPEAAGAVAQQTGLENPPPLPAGKSLIQSRGQGQTPKEEPGAVRAEKATVSTVQAFEKRLASKDKFAEPPTPEELNLVDETITKLGLREKGYAFPFTDNAIRKLRAKEGETQPQGGGFLETLKSLFTGGAQPSEAAPEPSPKASEYFSEALSPEAQKAFEAAPMGQIVKFKGKHYQKTPKGLKAVKAPK